MLFNSYEFIFIYFPIVFFGFFWISKYNHRAAAIWLVIASLFFYGWWNVNFVLLLVSSILFNYIMGYIIGHHRLRLNKESWFDSKIVLIVAIISNLLLLGYFKYINFFILTFADMTGKEFVLDDVLLPLGISFFTFTQIAYLVDVYRGVSHEYNFIHYILFVTYFPHLIAGPVLHHKQMMPQFAHSLTYKINISNLNIGLTIFTIGLFKKVFLADQYALYANQIFEAVEWGGKLGLFESWIGALSYALQLYFDFSGYSDMAIGVSRMFNIKLPVNFNSPYKSKNIIEFWRNWHITLSSFLRDYLYIPLGGNRYGTFRRFYNVFITMLLGGLWHGASWNFIIWGALHGLYLIINHGWQAFSRKLVLPSIIGGNLVSGLITFIAVVIAWVPFRSNNLESSINMLNSMVMQNGISVPINYFNQYSWLTEYGFSFNGFLSVTGIPGPEVVIWLTMGFFIVWIFPNAQNWMSEEDSKISGLIFSLKLLRWSGSRKNAVFTGVILGISLLCITRVSKFLYFQF